MQLNPHEQSLWEQHKSFFAPDGQPNADAFEAYFAKYSSLTLDGMYVNPHVQMLIGTLLKQAPDEAFSMAFPVYYERHRTNNNSSSTELFDAWLNDIASERPDVLAKGLKAAAPNLNFTLQVMVLRDAQKFFPGSNIKDYAAPKLLKTKPSVILKQLNPNVSDMPYLLDMSAALMRDEDPQSKALGDTIVRGMFIARYGMPPENSKYVFSTDYRRPTDKYSSHDAFGMLDKHQIRMDPSVLLEQVRLRYNAKSVVFDALAYPIMVFEQPDSTPEARENAMAVVQNVLTYAEQNPEHGGLTYLVDLALARLHDMIPNPTLQQNIEKYMVARMAHSEKTASQVLQFAEKVDGPLFGTLVKHAVGQVPQKDLVPFMKDALHNMDTFKTKTRAPFELSHLSQGLKRELFQYLPADKLETYLSSTLKTCFGPAPDNYMAMTDKVWHARSLKGLFSTFAQLDWTPEKAETFKNSPLAPTAILLYLYVAAAGYNDRPEVNHQAGAPFTEWDPLPFLKAMYPEKQALWNQMTVGLLKMPVEDIAEIQKRQYEWVMASMYQAFSQTFLTDGLSFEATRGVIEALDANPLDYFINAHKNTGPALSFDLPDNMFDFQ